MIYTVTLNPALDYVMHIFHLTPGGTNRAQREELQIGGKGINVSLILRQLGIESVALGFLAGDTGELLLRRLTDTRVKSDFVFLPDGMTRINVKLKGTAETELNGQGPPIPPEALQCFFHKLDQLREDDTLILAGSIPPSLPPDTYEQALSRLAGKKVRCAVDAAGELLARVLPFRPFLIKPNHHELEELIGETLNPKDNLALIRAAQSLQHKGARNVLISLAQYGSLLVSEEGKAYPQPAAAGTLQNSVGAGDSMVAGFLAGYDSGSYEEALLLATAAGGATAFSPRLATKDEIQAVYRQLKKG